MLNSAHPDIIEDCADPKQSAELVLKSRLRNEVCGSLMNTSKIYSSYLLKKTVEFILPLILVGVNFVYESHLIQEHEAKLCEIPLGEEHDKHVSSKM